MNEWFVIYEPTAESFLYWDTLNNQIGFTNSDDAIAMEEPSHLEMMAERLKQEYYETVMVVPVLFDRNTSTIVTTYWNKAISLSDWDKQNHGPL